MENKFEQLNNTPDTTAEFSSEDIQQNKVMAILAYFGLLVLVPIFGAKDSKFARYHANQGLVLFLAAIAYSIATSILTSILIAISWRLAFLSTIFSLVSIAFLVLMVLGIINAATAKQKNCP